MVDIRLPSITGNTDREQLIQIRSYLYQLARQLQLALTETERKSQAQEIRLCGTEAKAGAVPSAASQFQSLKALIIKSADIVEAYYDEIENMLALSGKYVASSDFGTYKEETAMRIGANNEAVQQSLNRVQSLTNLVDGMSEKVLSQQSYIRYGAVGTGLDDTGLAASTAPGIEIGDYAVLNNGASTVTNRRFARFTAYGLELFGDSKDAGAVAYIKQNKLYIANAEVTGTFKLGGFLVSNSDGLSFDWAGVS